MTETTIQLKGGYVTHDPRLDRVPFHDPRNRDWQVRDYLEGLPRADRSPSRYPAEPTLDQGSLGACVGFSIATLLNASPVRRDPEWGPDEARWLYFSAQQEDQWPGGEYPGAVPRMSGTSTVAALRIAKRHGIIGDYRWLGAGSGRLADDVVDTLENLGPFIAGIPIYWSMFEPDEHGVLEVDPSSGIAGYHAIVTLDYRHRPLPGRGSKKVDHVVMQNTWGPWGDEWYGIDGHCYVPLTDLIDHLLDESVWGEAVWFDHPKYGPGHAKHGSG